MNFAIWRSNEGIKIFFIDLAGRLRAANQAANQASLS